MENGTTPSMYINAPRITDLSSIDAENFKERNTKFLKSPQPYERLGVESFRRLRHDIWVTRNGDIRRVLREFPFDEPLVDQCAGWMHAVVGKHFFPDANHRTAIALLRKLLEENNIKIGDWPVEVSERATKRSHKVRKEIEEIRLDTLYKKDRLFLVWRLYFSTVLGPTKLQPRK